MGVQLSRLLFLFNDIPSKLRTISFGEFQLHKLIDRTLVKLDKLAHLQMNKPKQLILVLLKLFFCFAKEFRKFVVIPIKLNCHAKDIFNLWTYFIYITLLLPIKSCDFGMVTKHHKNRQLLCSRQFN